MCAHRFLVAAFVAGILFLSSSVLTAASIRLAIVPLDPSLANESDLLTAEFSAVKDLVLLERAEIEKVRRELNLTSQQEQQSIGLGKTLGADGVLLLERREASASLVLTLVAVKPGVLLTSASYPWPVKDAAQWAKLFSVQTQPFLAKLEVSAADAVPISILNLRSAVKSAQAEKLERSLTVLLIDRLAREQRLFVLERRHMQLLGSEKELSGTADSPFWNGKWLVEGVIDEEGFSPTEMTVNVRVRAQGAGNPVAIRLRGARTNLTGMVNRIATNIVAALKVPSTLAAWQPADEARQYLEEATWALRWGMLAEAQAASDAAWELGLESMEAATIRVRSYAAGTVPQLGRRYIRYEPYRMYCDLPPDPRKLLLAQNALENYFDFTVQSSATASVPASWFELGTETLRLASESIRHFYYMEESRGGHEELLQQTRADARAVADSIRKMPQLRYLFWKLDGTLIVSPADVWHDPDLISIFYVQAEMGAYWYDRPTDALDLYRDLFNSGYFHRIRKHLWGRDPSRLLYPNLDPMDPLLVPWDKVDRAGADGVWQSFLDEMCVSTNRVAQLEAWFWKLNSAKNDEALEIGATNLFRLFLEKSSEFFSDRLDPTLRTSTEALLRRRATNENIPVQARLRMELTNYLNHRATAEVGFRAEQKRDEERQRVQKAKDYLAKTKSYDHAEIFEILGRTSFSAEAARELLPWVSHFKTNCVGALREVGWLEQRLNRAIQRGTNTVVAKVRTTLPPTNGPAVKPAPVAAPPPWAGLVADTAPVMLRHFWVPELPPSVPENHVSKQAIVSTRYSHHELWIEVLYTEMLPQNWGSDSRAVFRVSLPSLKSEYIRSTTNEVLGTMPVFWRDNRRATENSENKLFVSNGNRISRYDFTTRQWRDLPVPIENDVVIYAEDPRLLLSGKDSIVELDPKTETTRVLASARRNPPVTLLDSVLPFSYPPLVVSDARLQAVVQNGVYELNRSSSEWQEVGNISNYWRWGHWQPTSRGFTVHLHPDRKWHRVLYYPLGRKPEVLFQNLPPRPEDSVFEQASDSAAWETPAHTLLVGRAMEFDGENVWLLGPTLSNAPASLLYFDRKEKTPFVIPLANETKGNPAFLDPYGYGAYPPTAFYVDGESRQLLLMPEGMVITGKVWPGFWFIPQADLLAAKKQFARPNSWNGKEENRNMASGLR